LSPLTAIHHADLALPSGILVITDAADTPALRGAQPVLPVEPGPSAAVMVGPYSAGLVFDMRGAERIVPVLAVKDRDGELLGCAFGIGGAEAALEAIADPSELRFTSAGPVFVETGSVTLADQGALSDDRDAVPGAITIPIGEGGHFDAFVAHREGQPVAIYLELDQPHEFPPLSQRSRLAIDGDLPEGQVLASLEIANRDLSGADLSGRRIRWTLLRSVNARGAILRNATLEGTLLEDVDLSDADLSRATLDHVVATRTIFKGASFGAEITSSTFVDCDLTGLAKIPTFEETNSLRGCSLGPIAREGFRFAGQLTDCDLPGARLPKAVLDGVDLSGSNLAGADLAHAKLKRANLTRAILADAVLRQANLTDADLTGADLRNADLEQIQATGASFRNADLRDANLRGAILRDADLTGADLDGADLRKAKLEGTTMPSG
jgi:uncharacterized protein YjbI with pentapeptide repeats